MLLFFFYYTSLRPLKRRLSSPETTLFDIPKMSIYYFKKRFSLIIPVALLGVTLFFLSFNQTSPSLFHRRALGPILPGEGSIQHVFNQTLGVSTTDIVLQLLARTIP